MGQVSMIAAGLAALLLGHASAQQPAPRPAPPDAARAAEPRRGRAAARQSRRRSCSRVSWRGSPWFTLCLFEVVAISLAVVVEQALLARDFAVADDARLQICDQSIDLIEAQGARGGLQIVRRGA